MQNLYENSDSLIAVQKAYFQVFYVAFNFFFFFTLFILCIDENEGLRSNNISLFFGHVINFCYR